MNPILTLKFKCPYCANGYNGKWVCGVCGGIGQTTKNYYDLRDFEEKKNAIGIEQIIIPFKDYEIKTAKELDMIFQNELENTEDLDKWEFEVAFHNIKEDDKLVVTTNEFQK